MKYLKHFWSSVTNQKGLKGAQESGSQAIFDCQSLFLPTGCVLEYGPHAAQKGEIHAGPFSLSQASARLLQCWKPLNSCWPNTKAEKVAGIWQLCFWALVHCKLRHIRDVLNLQCVWRGRRPMRPNSALSWQGKSHCSNVVPFSLVLCAGSAATFTLRPPICSHHFQAWLTVSQFPPSILRYPRLIHPLHINILPVRIWDINSQPREGQRRRWDVWHTLTSCACYILSQPKQGPNGTRASKAVSSRDGSVDILERKLAKMLISGGSEPWGDENQFFWLKNRYMSGVESLHFSYCWNISAFFFFFFWLVTGSYTPKNSKFCWVDLWTRKRPSWTSSKEEKGGLCGVQTSAETHILLCTRKLLMPCCWSSSKSNCLCRGDQASIWAFLFRHPVPMALV